MRLREHRVRLVDAISLVPRLVLQPCLLRSTVGVPTVAHGSHGCSFTGASVPLRCCDRLERRLVRGSGGGGGSPPGEPFFPAAGSMNSVPCVGSSNRFASSTARASSISSSTVLNCR